MTDLESKMIPVSDWSTAPAQARELAEQGTRERVPTGIGWDEKLGWFVLCTAGQGPCLVWKEK